jgi:hypothetical protein
MSKFLFSTFFYLLLPFLCFGGGGCSRPHSVAQSRQIQLRAPLPEALKEIDARFNRVRSVVAMLDVILTDNGKRKDFELEGRYLGDADENLRLRLSRGESVVFDAAFDGPSVNLLLPRKERFLRGSRQALLNTPENEFALLAHAGHARDLFFPRPWTNSAVERRLVEENGRETVLVVEQTPSRKTRVRKVTLSPELPVVESQEVFDRQGRYVGLLEYFDYRFPATDTLAGKTNQSLEPYPQILRLTAGNGQWTLQLKVRKIILNETITQDKFQLRSPEGFSESRLDDFLKSNEKLWE